MMAPVLQHYFLVDDPLQTLLTKLIDGVQRTPSWDRLRYSCFVMAGFVQRAFLDMGHRAEIFPCTGLAIYKQQPFKLGFPGIKKTESQLDGHVACLVNETILIDFGLGNVSRYGFREYPIALGADLGQAPRPPITLTVNPDIQFQWDIEQVNALVIETVKNHEAYSKQLYAEYLALDR